MLKIQSNEKTHFSFKIVAEGPWINRSSPDCSCMKLTQQCHQLPLYFSLRLCLSFHCCHIKWIIPVVFFCCIFQLAKKHRFLSLCKLFTICQLLFTYYSYHYPTYNKINPFFDAERRRHAVSERESVCGAYIYVYLVRMLFWKTFHHMHVRMRESVLKLFSNFKSLVGAKLSIHTNTCAYFHISNKEGKINSCTFRHSHRFIYVECWPHFRTDKLVRIHNACNELLDKRSSSCECFVVTAAWRSFFPVVIRVVPGYVQCFRWKGSIIVSIHHNPHTVTRTVVDHANNAERHPTCDA